MTAGRRWMRALAVVGAVAWSGVVAVPSADAVAPSAVGWWWVGRNAPAPVPVEPVPAVPDGGLYVAGDPTGPSAVSALRFELPAGAVRASMILIVAEAVGSPAVEACAATAAWTAVHGGPWDQRPPADCTRLRSPGTVSTDGGSVAFDFDDLGAGQVLDVVLAPAAVEAPAPGGPPPFAVSFRAPDDAVLTVETQPIEEEEEEGEPPPPPAVVVDDPGPPPMTFDDVVLSPDALPELQVDEAPQEPEVDAGAGEPIATRLPVTGEFAFVEILLVSIGMLLVAGFLAVAMTTPVSVLLGERR